MTLRVPSLPRRVWFVGLALCVVFAAACEAGPSTFDRQQADTAAPQAIPDSADVSTLRGLPAELAGESSDPDSGPVAIDVADIDGGSVAPAETGEGADASGDFVASAETGELADTGGDSVAPMENGEVSDSLDAVERSEASGTGGDSVASAGAVGSDVGPSGDVRFPHPDHVRGLYVNAWAAGSRNRLAGLLEIAARTEINTFVIDIKDASGYISHRTDLQAAHDVGATEEIRIRDLPGLLERLAAAGIYPIARIVVVKDPLLSSARPELAVQDTAGGVWVDGKGIVWLNPYNREVWQYHVALAREVALLGFPEIQWDYVRFPDSPISDRERATYPGTAGQSKPDAIRAFLAYSRDGLADLGVEVTADVFGVTTSASRDIGIGQVWESFIDVVDVALPMVYPSHYFTGSFGFDSPNSHPYEIVRAALRNAVRRSAEVDGAGMTRPWLQDFSLGEPKYAAPEVRAQIQGAYDAGVEEWILWNPGSYYTEDALEPSGGFITEPLLRVGDEIVPLSRRY